jgi:hypothetical protein
MPTETVDQLIEQLKSLKIQEDAILEKLSRARKHEKEAESRIGTKKHEKEIENRIGTTQKHEKEAEYRTGTPRNTTFDCGDRVRITNEVRVPFTRSVNARDKTATVRYTKSRNEQVKVFITTDNGLKTWRLERNLRKL